MFNFFQHIYHTGHQNSKWRQNETLFWCVTCARSKFRGVVRVGGQGWG